MAKKEQIRKLIIVKPEDHEVGKGLSQEVFRASRLNIEGLRKFIGHTHSAAVYCARTNCAVQTGIIVACTFHCTMPHEIDVLNTMDAHESFAQDYDSFMDFLRVAVKKHELLVIVTHIGSHYDDKALLSTTLETELSWTAPTYCLVKGAKVIEYQIEQ